MTAALVEATAKEVGWFVARAVAAGGATNRVADLVEAAAVAASARIGLAMVQGVVDGWDGDVGGSAPCPSCGGPCPGKGTRPVTVSTLLGPVVARRRWYHCGSCRHGFAPLDDVVGVRWTAGVERACGLAGSEMGFRRAAALVDAVAGHRVVSASTLGRVARMVGRRAGAHAAGDPTRLSSDAVIPDTVYLLIDGTGAPMVPAETAGRPGKSPDGRSHTREVKIGCVFTQSTGGPGQDPSRDPGSTTYVNTFAPADGFARILKTERDRRGLGRCRQPVVIGDGAAWIWTIAERDYPDATHIVDYWHACEHVHDLVAIVDHLLADPKHFEQHLVDLLHDGDIPGMDALIDTLHLDTYKGKLHQRVMKAMNYFHRNRHRMNYPHYQAMGWFIGSGPVEAACKTIVGQRAKQAGMRWTITGLDPILTIRALHRSNRDHLLWPTPQT